MEGTNSGATQVSGNGDDNFEPGEVFSIQVPVSLSEGRTYIAKVVTPAGVEASLSFSYEA